GAMDGRLLLLLLLGGALCAPRSCPGAPDPGPAPVSAVGGWGGLRTGFSVGGWNPPGPALPPRSWDPPAAPFWTMATPQRFGRRR
uniref:Uncharacterized protein n=1 Tax=Strigops habroptila TaxID=2489341 RepID=A0A672UWW8_STRHB